MSEMHFDDEPSRWFASEPRGRIDLAAVMADEADRLGRSGFNATAWLAAAAGIATIIGGVIAFGLAAACVFAQLG